MVTPLIVNAPACVVQASSTLPPNNSGWTLRPELIPIRGEEGAGQNLGNFTINYMAGNVSLPGANNVSLYSPLAWIGYYARVLKQDSSGSILISGVSFSVLFTGIITKQKTMPDGAIIAPGGLQVLTIIGLPSILDSIYVNQGFMQGFNASTNTSEVVTPLTCPLFNALPTRFNTALGERSSSKQSIGSSNAYAHDLITRNAVWLAADVVELLLVGFGQPQIPPNFASSGPTWQISDPLGFLNYVPDKLDFTGKSVLDCINMLINPRRGCTWRCTVDGNVITITTYSGCQSAISIGTSSLPASTTTVALDARGNSYISDLCIDEDATSRFDYIEVRGAHPLAGLTLHYKDDQSGSLKRGWTASLQTGGPNGLWDPSGPSQGPEYEYVWRRFVLSPTWNGATYGSTTIGLRNRLDFTTDASSMGDIASYGAGGYKGTRSFSTASADFYVPSSALKLDKFYPLVYNVDYSTGTVTLPVDLTQPLLAPMAFLFNSSTAAYLDISSQVSIEIEEDPPAIIVSGDSAEICTFIQDGYELLITIGMREPDPLTVSWQNADASGTNWFSEVPRVLVRELPNCEQWIALRGSLLSANLSTSAPNQLSASYTILDDTAKLTSWLAVLRAWYGANAVTATWTDHSQLDSASGTGKFQPGALLTTVHRGDSAVTSNSLITSRAWDLTQNNFGTTYTTERVIPDVVSIEGHPRIVNVRRRQQEMDAQ